MTHPIRHRIKTVETTIAILESLEEQNACSVTEIAEQTGLAKSTVSKHLQTLHHHELVSRTNGENRLSFRFLEIGAKVRDNIPYLRLIRDKVSKLADNTNLVAQFSVEEHGWMVVICSESGEYGAASKLRPERRLPLHSTAGGKAIMAHLPEKYIATVVDSHGLPKYTDQTITNQATLFTELSDIRERGYAINREEDTEGFQAIGVPIHAREDDLIGAIGIGGPSHYLEGEITEFADVLVGVANELELDIAHS